MRIPTHEYITYNPDDSMFAHQHYNDSVPLHIAVWDLFVVAECNRFRGVAVCENLFVCFFFWLIENKKK